MNLLNWPSFIPIQIFSCILTIKYLPPANNNAEQKNTNRQTIICCHSNTEKLEEVCCAPLSQETPKTTEKESHDSQITTAVRTNLLLKPIVCD